MWVISHCLAWGSTCQPQSWVDLLEIVGAAFVVIAGALAFFLLLLSLG